jgi:transposase-like protein
MLAALVAYFERSTTVQVVCARYNIAISTLYAWKDRLLEQKDLLLGILMSRKEPAQAFVRDLFESTQLSDRLKDFFCRYAFSFLQKRTEVLAKLRTPPTRSSSHDLWAAFFTVLPIISEYCLPKP